VCRWQQYAVKYCRRSMCATATIARTNASPVSVCACARARARHSEADQYCLDTGCPRNADFNRRCSDESEHWISWSIRNLRWIPIILSSIIIKRSQLARGFVVASHVVERDQSRRELVSSSRNSNEYRSGLRFDLITIGPFPMLLLVSCTRGKATRVLCTRTRTCAPAQDTCAHRGASMRTRKDLAVCVGRPGHIHIPAPDLKFMVHQVTPWYSTAG